MLAREISVLSEKDCIRIHEAALTVLEKRGFLFEEEELRKQLIARGAKEGKSEGEISLPRELVSECLDICDRSPILRCVNGKTLHHTEDDRYYGCLVTDPYILDFQAGLRKPSLDDIARHARLGDALPLIDCIHLMDDTVPDLESAASELKCIETFVENTTTCYHCAPGSLRGTRYWIEISEIMAGGSLKDNPILSAYLPTVSPLTLTEFNIKQLRLFLQHGIFFYIGPCAIAGATAPYPLAGLVVQSWAESLAPIVAAQVIRPGAPVMLSAGGAHPMDMTTGNSLYSGASKALASAAMSNLSSWIDLPISTGNFTTLCSDYGAQNGIESAMSVFTTFFSRANCCGGIGSLANACGMGAEQVVLHHDFVETLERIRRGIDLSEEKLAIDSIITTGPRGNFLGDELTLKYLRSDEHFFASSIELCAGGRDEKTMAQNAHERAEDIIASHKPDVPADRLEEVHKYVERELKRLGNE